MSDMAKVLAAVKTVWDANRAVAFAAFNGPFRDEEEAEGTAFPFCIVNDQRGGGGSSLLEYSCASEFWEHDFSLLIYDSRKDLCEAHANTVLDVLKAATFTISPGTHKWISWRETDRRFFRDDKGVARAEIEFNVRTSKPRLDV